MAQITRREPQVTVNGIRTLRVRSQLSSSKAVRELGASFRPFEDTLRDEVQWYVDPDYVKTNILLSKVRVVDSSI
jgi:dihydroflavonol-4-reductase